MAKKNKINEKKEIKNRCFVEKRLRMRFHIILRFEEIRDTFFRFRFITNLSLG